MGRFIRVSSIVAALVVIAAAGPSVEAVTPTSGVAEPKAAAEPHKTLKAFASESELQRYLKKLHRRAELMKASMAAEPVAAPPPTDTIETMTVTGARADDNITNNQEANVDEGDIVKARGDLLIVLRRGRLFTVSIAGGGMKAVDSINAYPPSVDAHGDWYDEMLIAGDRVVVIGYSYSRGGTQINRFRLDAAGHLRYEDAYQLRSNDYYSSRNYASRLIGTKLVFYTPRYLPYGGEDLTGMLPALRRWSADGNKAKFERIGTAREVYMPPGLDFEQVEAVHTVVSCDVAAAVLGCKATSVFGPEGRVFYMSQNAVYVWLSSDWCRFAHHEWFWRHHRCESMPSSFVYRLPLDGGVPSAIAARGSPVDQFSFREDAQRGSLDVLVRADSAGDAMWTAEHSAGAVALVRIPLTAFGDGQDEVSLSRYRPLPMPKGSAWAFHNRFVGDFILYGVGNGWGRPEKSESMLVVAPIRGGEVSELMLPHGIDRIEVMGRDAVVVGSDDKNLNFSAVLLGQKPALGDRYVLADAAQSETRSHGFFFKPERDDDGVLGLPVSRPAKPAYRQLFDSAAAVVFVRRSAGKFAPLGELGSHPESASDDACVASCVDWYGNARPIFKGSRAFALMGYELVEGKLADAAISELGRVNFAPEKAARTN